MSDYTDLSKFVLKTSIKPCKNNQSNEKNTEFKNNPEKNDNNKISIKNNSKSLQNNSKNKYLKKK